MNVKLKNKHVEKQLPDSGNIMLAIVSGVNKGKKYKIPGSFATIGRSEENDIEIVSVKISKKHARIEKKGGNVSIVDLDSANGTFLNGKRVKQALLKNGDRISFGGACEIIINGDFKFGGDDLVLDKILEGAKELEKNKRIITGPPKLKPVQKKGSSSFKSFLMLLLLIGVGYILYDFNILTERETSVKDGEAVGDLIKDQAGVQPYVSQKLDPSKDLRKINITGLTRSQREADLLFFRAYNVYLSNRFNDATALFKEVLIFDRNHALAHMYLERTKTELEELIDLHDREGRTLYKNLHYHQAIIKFRSVMNLLKGREDDPRYKDARKFIKLSERKLIRY